MPSCCSRATTSETSTRRVTRSSAADSSPPRHTPATARRSKPPANTESPGEEPPLVVREEVKAPVHGLAQRPVAGSGRTPRRDEEPEPVVEARVDLAGATTPSPGRRRAPSRAAARPARRRSGRRRRGWPRPGRGSGGPPWPDRGTARRRPTGGRRRHRRVRGQPERRHRVGELARDAEWLTAGRQDAQVGRRREQPGGECRGGVAQVLAVVEDQEQVPVSEPVAELVDGVGLGMLAELEGIRDLPASRAGSASGARSTNQAPSA